MSDKDMPTIEVEKDVDTYVREWVNRNETQFKRECKRLYKENIFKRCQRHIGAPCEYLENQPKIIPDITKWYHQVFQTVFLASLIGFIFVYSILTHPGFGFRD